MLKSTNPICAKTICANSICPHLRLLAQLHSLDLEEVDVGREGAEEVKDVVASVVPDDSLVLDRGAQLHLLALVSDHLVRKDLQLVAGLLQQVQVLALRDNRLAEVNGAADDGLLLLPLQDAGDDRLGGDPVAPVVEHHHGAQGEQALQVHRVVDLDALQVVPRGDIGSRVPPRSL